LVDRAEAGDSIDITRRGKPVARLTAVATPRKPIDAALLGALTATMPPQKQTAADLVRSMRDGDRY
jgi:antitoxin (DNA-binding transcriptional repressor) of toxin-antitoxin stability system